MKSTITLTDIEHMKGALRASLPDVKSSHRVEALARGLGWLTNASMRAALAAAPVESRRDRLSRLSAGTFVRRAERLLVASVRAGRRPSGDGPRA
jgi:hypothetical protein